METVVFALLASCLLGSLAYMVVVRKVVQVAFAFFFLLFCMAGLFAWLGAPFLAASQVIVYVGGILVLALFGVMLSGRGRHLARHAPVSGAHQVGPGLLVALGLGGGLWWAFRDAPFQAKAYAPHVSQNTQGIGLSMLTDYLLAFELASALLLAALVGAAFLSRAVPTHSRNLRQANPPHTHTPDA